MYLDYYVMDKRQEMMREAEHDRLVRQALAGNASRHLLSSAADVLGQQLIRLGTSLLHKPQSQGFAIQPKCVTC